MRFIKDWGEDVDFDVLISKDNLLYKKNFFIVFIVGDSLIFLALKIFLLL